MVSISFVLLYTIVLRPASFPLPALFYGLYRDVKRRTRRIIHRIPKGVDWMALVEAEGFLDVAETPGMILLGGPSPVAWWPATLPCVAAAWRRR
jgi:hypothetical protein